MSDRDIARLNGIVARLQRRVAVLTEDNAALRDALADIVNCWPEFDEPDDSESCEVNGGDLVDWMGGQRLGWKALLAKVRP